MKNSWIIFRNDIQNIYKNWVAAVLIGGLIFLPSLYAWLNIYASWDPYSQTNQLPVAIVNEDVGAEVRGDQMNIGNELVDLLKNNQDMKWFFTSRENAMEKLEIGDYFAIIIIPSDFSAKLASVVTDNPEKAAMEYYVNEKINSIAPKITTKGASVIVDKVSAQFIATVNGVIFDLFNDLGIKIEKELPDIKKLENYIFKMEQDLPAIYNMLKGTQDDVESAQTVLNKTQALMPKAEQMTKDGVATIEKTTGFLSKAQQRLNEMAPLIEKDLEKVSKISKETNEILQKVQAVQLDFSELDQVNSALDSKMTSSIQTVNSIEDDFHWLMQLSDGLNQQERWTHVLNMTTELKAFLQEAQANARTINKLVEDKHQQMDKALNDLQIITQNTSIRLDAFLLEYKNTIEPSILTEIAQASYTLQNAKGILTNIQTTLPEVERILTSTNTHMKEGKIKLDNAVVQYPYISDKVKQVADRIRKVQGETTINEIIQLLRNDPLAERSFFEEPIVLNENKLFPIANYGTGMSPFYTVLSIWVGCILLISLLATDVKHDQNISHHKVYFGRLFTFSAIGILQALIVTLGDIILLGVDVKDSYWFILFGLLISFVFMTIVYTLVSVFGDIGKAFVIVMLVLQIAGSGGTYPIVLLPDFFQWINPFLPFTYAISLMREAVGGIVWPRVLQDVTFLLLTCLAFLLFGTFLKEKINRKTKDLLKKSRESGLFH